MLRILAIGDAHIPRRANQIPSKITQELRNLTKDQLLDYTFFTGDVIDAPKFLDFLNLKTERDFFIVMGNMDYYGGKNKYPKYRRLEISLLEKAFTIGLTHGAQISPRGDHDQLEILALEREYNVLISGHTHKEEMFLTNEGILLINPGSVTGAWSFVASRIPSFIVIEIEEKTGSIHVILFRCENRTDEISKSSDYFKFNGSKINRF